MIRCPRLRRLTRDTEGSVLLETVIAFPVLFLFVLVIMELSMLYNAKQLANYAAFCAARTASVYGIDSTAAPKRHFATAMALSPIASANVNRADDILRAYWLPDPTQTVAVLCSIPGFQGDDAKWMGRLANAYVRTYPPRCDTGTSSGKTRKYVIANVSYIYRCSFLPLGNVWGQEAIEKYCDTLVYEYLFEYHPSWKPAVLPAVDLIRNAWKWNVRIRGRAVTDYWAG